MTAKEYLRRIKTDDLRINQKIKEYDNLSKRSTSLGSMDYSAVRVQTSPDGQGFTKTIDKLVDLQREINEDIDRYYDNRQKKIREIQSLDRAEYIEILYRRYVEGQPLEVIAAEMGYSYHWACHIHGEALKEFEKTVTFRKEPQLTARHFGESGVD